MCEYLGYDEVALCDLCCNAENAYEGPRDLAESGGGYGGDALSNSGKARIGWLESPIQPAVLPPSTINADPVIKLESSEARKSTALAISIVSATRPIGRSLFFASVSSTGAVPR